MTVERLPVRIVDLAQDVLDLMKVKAEARKLPLELSYDFPLPASAPAAVVVAAVAYDGAPHTPASGWKEREQIQSGAAVPVASLSLVPWTPISLRSRPPMRVSPTTVYRRIAVSDRSPLPSLPR